MVAEEGFDLGIDVFFGDLLDVVDDLGFEEEQCSRAVRGAGGGEEVGIAGGDDAVDRELPGPAVVGVEAVLLPGIVTEDHVGADGPDDRAHLFPPGRVVLELTVDRVEEVHVPGAQGAGGGALLFTAGGHQRDEVLLGFPASLRPVGEHQHLDVRPRAGPLGKGRAAPELDVVGVRADREDARCGARRRRRSRRG